MVSKHAKDFLVFLLKKKPEHSAHMHFSMWDYCDFAEHESAIKELASAGYIEIKRDIAGGIVVCPHTMDELKLEL